MAEREGFEPPVGLPPRRISSAVHSSTLPPLREMRGRALRRQSTRPGLWHSRMGLATPSINLRQRQRQRQRQRHRNAPQGHAAPSRTPAACCRLPGPTAGRIGPRRAGGPHVFATSLPLAPQPFAPVHQAAPLLDSAGFCIDNAAETARRPAGALLSLTNSCSRLPTAILAGRHEVRGMN